MNSTEFEDKTEVDAQNRIVGGDPVAVLFLIDQLRAMGGAERALLKILHALPPDRFRPIVATFDDDPQLPGLDRFPAPLHVLPLGRTVGVNALRVAWRLRALIRKEHVRIVHTFFETADLWGGVIAKLSGRPVLISSRRDMGIQRLPKHDLAYRILGRMFDQVHAVSDQVREFTLTRDRLPAGRVVTLYTGVDVDFATPPLSRAAICERLDVPVDSRIVVCVANVRPIKGIEVLVRASELVCKSPRPVAVIVVGAATDSGYMRELLTLRDACGLSRWVHFWGPEPDVSRILRGADVFTLLSHTEGFSNAVIEAMACGLPCVVTNVGGNAEAVIDGLNGYLVPRADHRAAARRINELLDAPEKRRMMGLAAIETVQRRFTVSAMIRQLTSYYDALLRREQER